MDPTAPPCGEEPVVAAFGAVHPAFSRWLDGLAARRFGVRRCLEADALLRCLHEETVDLVLAEHAHLGLEVGGLTRLIAEAAPDTPVVLAAADGPSPPPPDWFAAGVRWVIPLDAPLDSVEPVLRAIAAEQDRIRSAESALKALQSEARAAVERTRAMNVSLRELSHELGTPLSVVQGYCANLLDGFCGELAGDQRDSVERMSAACRLMIEVVARIKAQVPSSPGTAAGPDARVTRRRVVRLPELAREAADLMQPLYRAQSVSLELEAQPGCCPVWGERPRITQLLINLLTNALRHSKPGSVVRIGVCSEEGDGPRASRITVQDQGPGIPPEDQDKIFLPGWSSQARAGRQGLGLAICREIASDHSGRLWVVSAPGEGAAFHLSLPVDPRLRVRKLRLQLVDDPALAGQLLLELRRRSHGPVEIARPTNMEELADQIQGAGQPLALLGSIEPELERALSFVKK